MRRRARTAVGLTLAAGAALGAPAVADPIDAINLGVLAHNICVTDCKNADKEDGVNLTGELVFTSPDFLRWAFAPRPYLLASVNTAGETSYAGGGVLWNWRFADDWGLEPGVGYVVHSTDELDNPFPPGDARRGPFGDENLLLGSRDLFRTSLSLTRDLTPRLGVQLHFEHLSHGQILGEGRNQGLDEFGLRLSYRPGAR